MNLDFGLTLISGLHLLEWLDERNSFNPQHLAPKFGISSDVAKAICNLRNNLFHNRNDPITGNEATGQVKDHDVNLIKVVQATWGPLKAAKYIADRKTKPDNADVLNYVMSLAGRALLQRVGVAPNVKAAQFLDFGDVVEF